MTIESITIRHHEATTTTVASSVFNALGSVWDAVRKQAERQRAERALWKMDPRLFKDIGIDRSEIMSVVYTSSRQRRWSNGNR